MHNIYMEYWLPGAVCAAASLLTVFAGCSRFGRGCRDTGKAVEKILGGVKKLPGCDMANMAEVGAQFDGCGSEPLKNGFEDYRLAVTKMFKNEVAPEPEGYLGYREIITHSYSEGMTRAVWVLLGALGLLALTLPCVVLLMLGGDVKADLPICLGFSLIGLIVIGGIFAAAYTYVQVSRKNASVALFNLCKRLIALIPTATESTRAALLLESSRKNSEAFVKTAATIADKIDDFTVNGITPVVAGAFTDAIETKLLPPIGEMKTNLVELSTQVVSRQNEGMQALADSFSDKLEGSLGASVKSLCTDLESVSARLDSLGGALNDTIKNFDTATDNDRQMLQQVSQLAQTTAKTQNEAAQQLSAMAQALDSSRELMSSVKQRDEAANAALAAQLAAAAEMQAGIEKQIEALKAAGEIAERRMSDSVDKLMGVVESQTGATSAKVDEIFGSYSGRLLEAFDKSSRANDLTAEKLAATMDSLANAGSEQYEKAAQAAAQLLNDVVAEMNNAMDGVGHEIAESINAASAGSVEIVQRLAEKTEQLKAEYDTFYNRCQDANIANVDSMEAAVQSVLGTFTDDAGQVMAKLETNISSAMNLFEGNTSELLSSLEEQARSIGLYAKELNFDVSSLSDSLRESVQIFTDQVSAGTQKTFSDFDAGLTEVSNRLANTIESVREAVEKLPEAVGGAKKG